MDDENGNPVCPICFTCQHGDMKALTAIPREAIRFHDSTIPGLHLYSSALSAAVCNDQVECAVWLIRECGSRTCLDKEWCAMDSAKSGAMVHALHALGAHMTHTTVWRHDSLYMWKGRIRAMIDCGYNSHENRDVVKKMLAQHKLARQRAVALLGVARRCPWMRDPLGIVARFTWAMRWVDIKP